MDATLGRSRVPYAELHCHSTFSFLDGASDPEALVEEAARLGLNALALTDHDGVYGVVRFAEAARVPTVATNQVHYTAPSRGRLAAVRARRSLDEMAGWLPPAPSAHLRSGAEMARLFARYPGAVQRSAQIGVECSFDLQLIPPSLPPYPVPDGHDEDSWLRHLALAGAADRYGPPARAPQAYEQIEHELRIIAGLGFPGYVLIMHSLVDFCRRSNILCQGRGSAASSAVCYALGVTNCDPVKYGLLFERFLAPERAGPPDIESGRRGDLRPPGVRGVPRGMGQNGRTHRFA